MSNKNTAIYYNCFSGISGDMNLAAMLDLGVPVEELRKELRKTDLDHYEINASRDSRNGISGTRVDITFDPEKHHNRDLQAILKMIDSSSLSESVKITGKDIFLNLGKAEAKIHEVPLKKVHFHEVGAVDSVVDIIGAAICLDYLQPANIIAGTIELGGGFVKSSHGILPVPAPATTELLKNIPAHLGGADFETTTPTGAAILATVVDSFTDEINLKILKTGYGIGHKQSTNPNVLRVFLCEAETPGQKQPGEETALLMECNIDDMNPEWYELTIEKLFNAGAQDVYLTNIMMKKSRPGVKVSVLCREHQLPELKKILLTETTSLGLRVFPFRKTFLERKYHTISTKFGDVRIKSSYYMGEMIRQKPEYEDCKRIALSTSTPIDKILKEVEYKLKGM